MEQSPPTPRVAAALPRGLSFTVLCAAVLGSARRIAHAHGATFVLRDGDDCCYVDEDAIAPLWRGQRFPVTECLSGWCMTHGRPAVVADITLDDRVPLAAYRPTFVSSMAMVPMGEPAVGALGVYWARTDPDVSAGTLEQLQSLARETGDTLVRLGLVALPTPVDA
ncbi:GAF domain-containing protein [Jatrophihabitans fulvus]